MRTLLTRIEGGAFVKPTKLTVEAYLLQWLDSYVTTNATPRTRDRYKGIVKTHLIPAFGSLQLVALQP